MLQRKPVPLTEYSIQWRREGERLSWDRLLQPRDLFLPRSSPSLEGSTQGPFLTCAHLPPQLRSYQLAQYAREQNTSEPSPGASLRERQKGSLAHIWQKLGWVTWERPQSSVCTLAIHAVSSLLLMKTDLVVVIATPATEDVGLS